MNCFTYNLNILLGELRGREVQLLRFSEIKNRSVILVTSEMPLDFPFGGNSSSSSNSSSEACAIDGKPVGTKELKIAIHLITLVVALVGNSLLIAAFVRMRKEPLMLLIANMAASDILTAIFLVPRLLTIGIVGSYAFQIHGLGGRILCKMCAFLSDISVSVSTQSLVIIAVERFLAVVYPLKTRRITVKTRRLVIASTWVIAMAFHSPYLYTMELVIKENNETMCRQSKWFLDKELFHRYNVFLYFTLFAIPIFAVSILYPIIFIHLRIDKMSAHRSTRGDKRSRRRNRNLLKLAVATVLALLISWTGYITIFFLELFVPETLPKCSYSFKVVYFAAIVLASSYCAINPFICFMFLRNFRTQLIIMCKMKRRGTLKFDRKLAVGLKRAPPTQAVELN